MDRSPSLTQNEARYAEQIRSKDLQLRQFLSTSTWSISSDARQWLRHLLGIKMALGNLNNDLGFVATLLVKEFLEKRFQITNFDAAGKPQGAAGVDIEARTAAGETIIGELKTTKPYQPGFGAAQRTTILKDLARLAASDANHRFMFVIDGDAFQTLCSHRSFATRAPGIEVVDVLSGRSHKCSAAR